MSILFLIISFVLHTLFAYWVIYKGGADYLEGWLSAFAISFWALSWNSEQIRFYYAVLWVFSALGFVFKLFMLIKSAAGA